MNKKFSLIILLFATLACALPGAAPAVDIPQQPVDLNSLQTIIVQTADAAQTQTAIANPSFTPTYTPTSTRIPTITPSPTVTFIFLLPSLTPIPTITPIGFVPSGGASGSDVVREPRPWSCRVLGTQPPKGTVIEKKSTFNTYWTILNTGTKTWTRTTIDLVYKAGYRHEGTRIQDFPRGAAPGGTIVVGAVFIAPKAPGDYNSYFTLQVGNRQFCGMVVSFTVEE